MNAVKLLNAAAMLAHTAAMEVAERRCWSGDTEAHTLKEFKVHFKGNNAGFKEWEKAAAEPPVGSPPAPPAPARVTSPPPAQRQGGKTAEDLARWIGAMENFTDEERIKRESIESERESSLRAIKAAFMDAQVGIPMTKDDNIKSEPPCNFRQFSVSIGGDRGILAGLANPFRYNHCVSGKVVFQQLRNAGFKTVIGLDEKDSSLAKNRCAAEEVGITYEFVPVVDMSSPTDEAFEKISRIVIRCFNNFERVAVHCGEGYGRTGTVLSALLLRGKSFPISPSGNSLIKGENTVHLGHYGGNQVLPATEMVKAVIDFIRSVEDKTKKGKDATKGQAVEVEDQLNYLNKLSRQVSPAAAVSRLTDAFNVWQKCKVFSGSEAQTFNNLLGQFQTKFAGRYSVQLGNVGLRVNKKDTKHLYRDGESTKIEKKIARALIFCIVEIPSKHDECQACGAHKKAGENFTWPGESGGLYTREVCDDCHDNIQQQRDSQAPGAPPVSLGDAIINASFRGTHRMPPASPLRRRLAARWPHTIPSDPSLDC